VVIFLSSDQFVIVLLTPLTLNGGISQKLSECLVSGPRDSTNPYHLSNSCFKFSFSQSRRHSRWMKMAFQMLSSTSCSRSTTSVSNILKLKVDNLAENTFWNSEHKTNHMIERTLTIVRTKESSFRRVCTAAPSTGEFFRYIASCTDPMQLHHFTSSTRARDLHCIISWYIPILPTQSIGIRQRGHGQWPRLWMQAKSILRYGLDLWDFQVA